MLTERIYLPTIRKQGALVNKLGSPLKPAARFTVPGKQVKSAIPIKAHSGLDQLDHDAIHELFARHPHRLERAARLPIACLPPVVDPADEHIREDLAAAKPLALLKPAALEKPFRAA
jgi:hypothetical protein